MKDYFTYFKYLLITKRNYKFILIFKISKIDINKVVILIIIIIRA